MSMRDLTTAARRRLGFDLTLRMTLADSDEAARL
jgi:hypothetical protein